MATSNKAHELAEKIAAALAADDEPHIFSAQEVTEIQNVLRFFRRVETLKWAGKYVIWGVVTVGLILSNLDRIKEFFR